jgi:hypothetical protein
MSQVLEVIDLERLGLPQPKNIFELAQLIAAQTDDTLGPSPKYLELARGISALYPSPEAVAASSDPEVEESIWLEDPVTDAQRACAVWSVDLPPGGGAKLLYELIVQGRRLGLTLLLDSMGVAFLPDGRVLPEDQQDAWDIFLEMAPEQQRPTMGQMVKRLEALAGPRLALHGYLPLPREHNATVIEYRRPVDGGWQQVRFSLKQRYDHFYTLVILTGQCAPVRAILTAVLEAQVSQFPWEIDYHLYLEGLTVPKHPDFFLDTPEQIGEMFAVLEQVGLPLLDQVRTVAGLDRMFSEAPDTGAWRAVRNMQFTTLICAYLMRNPRFAEWEASLREEVKKHDRSPTHPYRTENLDRLLAYLREYVTPLAD